MLLSGAFFNIYFITVLYVLEVSKYYQIIISVLVLLQNPKL